MIQQLDSLIKTKKKALGEAHTRFARMKKKQEEQQTSTLTCQRCLYKIIDTAMKRRMAGRSSVGSFRSRGKRTLIVYDI